MVDDKFNEICDNEFILVKILTTIFKYLTLFEEQLKVLSKNRKMSRGNFFLPLINPRVFEMPLNFNSFSACLLSLRSDYSS